MGTPLKIVVIGGGSSYTPELIRGFIERAHRLNIGEVALVDIETGKEKLQIIQAFADKAFKKNNLGTIVTAYLSPEEALQNADYVITQIRVGGLSMRALDESIPVKHGFIGQETTGIGGFMKGLRTIPVIVDLAHLMEKHCPNAWLINFANPSGAVTEAVLKHTTIKTAGLCNVPINMQREIASLLHLPKEALQYDFSGLNHLCFVTDVRFEGNSLMNTVIEHSAELGTIVSNIETGAPDIEWLTLMGALPSPYLEYYFDTQAQLKKQTSAIESGEGSRAEQVMKTEKRLFDVYKNNTLDSNIDILEERGGSMYSEAAVSLIESLEGHNDAFHVLNVQNENINNHLPANAVIETTCYVSKNTIQLMSSKAYPAIFSGLVQSVKAYETLMVEAALTQSLFTAKQAWLAHPLNQNHENSLALLSEMLIANESYITLK